MSDSIKTRVSSELLIYLAMQMYDSEVPSCTIHTYVASQRGYAERQNEEQKCIIEKLHMKLG